MRLRGERKIKYGENEKIKGKKLILLLNKFKVTCISRSSVNKNGTCAEK
jgi:hypothetical protein